MALTTMSEHLQPAPLSGKIRVEIVDSLETVDTNEWNALGAAPYPFLRHEFLRALETHDAVSERYGWLPRHIIARDRDGALLGAVPLYLKTNSYGEFVFDWSWAEAYQRAGMDYYPKLVSAAPYTPATGPKLLLSEAAPAGLADDLIRAAMSLATQLDVSSLHWLFTPPEETARLQAHGLMVRHGCQFHWHNHAYQDFDDFLATFASAKRKKIKRERRRVREAGITFRQLRGDQVSDAEWSTYHRLYESTFHKRGGMPTLSEGFFRAIAQRMPEGILLVLAYHQQRIVAAAFNLVGEHSLYGRHWGCEEEFHSLHFEACYYQGLDFCIANGLAHFEPGAQGEHKVSRGFLPTTTYSAHWLADARFSEAVSHFLEHEREGMADYEVEMNAHSPYKATTDTD